MCSISLCMIVRDEEKVLDRCLESIKGAVDEIIIVDTGSIDETKDIASKYTDKIYDFKWNDNFSDARNYSFDKATKDYIMWLDADEYITIENLEKLIFLKSNIGEEIDVITLQTYMCIDENDKPRVVGRRNRIVKREKHYKWVGFLHEYIQACGTVLDSSIYIVHDKIKNSDGRNLKIYESNIEKGISLCERDLYYYGKELYCHKNYDEAINILSQFIEIGTYKDEIIDAINKVGECYDNKKEYNKARQYYYKTFEYGEPKGEVLFNIANSFENESKYCQAIRWYELLLNIDIPNDCCQCINICCFRFKPHLNLCVCYYEIGNLKKSYYHHLKAKEINPTSPSILKNDDFFSNIIKNNND